MRIERIETINNMEEVTTNKASSNDKQIIKNITNVEEQIQVPRGVSIESERMSFNKDTTRKYSQSNQNNTLSIPSIDDQ